MSDPYSFGGSPAGLPYQAGDEPPPDGNAIPATAQPTQGGPSYMAPSSGAGLGSFFGGLLGGGGGQAAQSGGGVTAPGMSQGLIGLGLGLMNMPKYQFYGQPGRWQSAMEGYQRGAAADVARAQQATTAKAQADTQRLRELQMRLMQAPQTKIVQGPFGPEIYSINPMTGKVTRGGPGGGALGTDTSAFEPNYNEQGLDENYLNGIRQRYGQEAAKAVQDVAAGRMPATGRKLQELMPMASRYKRDFNAGDYQTFLQAQKDFAPGGKDSEKVRAINQAIMHADAAWELSKKIGGYSLLPSQFGGGLINQAIQGYQGTGNTPEARQYQRDLAKYGEMADALGQELVTSAKSGSDVRAAHEHADRLKAAKTPAEREGAIQGAMQFLEGSHAALEEKRDSGRRARFEMAPLITPENQTRFDKIRNYTEGQAAPAMAAPATTGQGVAAPAAQGNPIEQARDAIRRGASREAVIRRLLERGINPAGL